MARRKSQTLGRSITSTTGSPTASGQVGKWFTAVSESVALRPPILWAKFSKNRGRSNLQLLPEDRAHLAFLSPAKWWTKDTHFQRFSSKPKFFEIFSTKLKFFKTKRATEFTTIVRPGKRVRALVGTQYDSTGAEFESCTYFSVNYVVNNVSFRDNATRGDETELTCLPDSSASISKAEPISVFCTHAQCENIAFARMR